MPKKTLCAVLAGFGLALTASSVIASTQITVADAIVTDGGSETFDLNNDGVADIEARIDVFPGAIIDDIIVSGDLITALLLGLSGPVGPLKIDGGQAIGAYSMTRFVQGENGPQTYQNGDEVQLEEGQRTRPDVVLYSEEGSAINVVNSAPLSSSLTDVVLRPGGPIGPVGLLAEPGATAVLGVVIETGLANFEVDTNTEEAFFAGFADEIDRTFGFVEVTRGSINVGTLGYNPTGGAALVSGTGASPVPLPASALLLLAGVGGLGALRLRKTRG